MAEGKSVNILNQESATPVPINQYQNGGKGNLYDNVEITEITGKTIGDTISLRPPIARGIGLNLADSWLSWKAMGVGVTFDVGDETSATKFASAVDASSAGKLQLMGTGADPLYLIPEAAYNAAPWDLVITVGGNTITGTGAAIYFAGTRVNS